MTRVARAFVGALLFGCGPGAFTLPDAGQRCERGDPCDPLLPSDVDPPSLEGSATARLRWPVNDEDAGSDVLADEDAGAGAR